MTTGTECTCGTSGAAAGGRPEAGARASFPGLLAFWGLVLAASAPDVCAEEDGPARETEFNREYVDTDGIKVLVSRKIETAPALDGVLDDPCWLLADRTKSAFVRWLIKAPSPKQTVAYVCHDDENLYLAVVCEEPNLKGLRMASHHPAGRKSWTTAGRGDNAEAFLELGGVGGTGQVFQFIFNIHPEVAYDGIYPPYVPFIGTGYRLKGGFADKRWIVELAFPYRGFNTDRTDRVDFRYQGPPKRGEVWGLRLVRNGPKYRDQDRMRSLWIHNPTTSHHIPFPTGAIVFEDRNALGNGRFREFAQPTNEPTHWGLTVPADGARAAIRLDKQSGHAVLEADLQQRGKTVRCGQTFGVLPHVQYRVHARLRKTGGVGKVALVIDHPPARHEFSKIGAWEEAAIEFFAGAGQRAAGLFLEVADGPAAVEIDEVRVEQQVYGHPKGVACLTGNSPRLDLNLDKKALEEVSYTYREPGTGGPQFPAYGGDGEASPGWIRVSRGALTRRGRIIDAVRWTEPGSSEGANAFPKGHEILFDLCQSYTITNVELRASGAISDLKVSVLSDEGQTPSAERSLRDPERRPKIHSPLYAVLDGIDGTGRYVRVWLDSRDHGLYFVRIWGKLHEK